MFRHELPFTARSSPTNMRASPKPLNVCMDKGIKGTDVSIPFIRSLCYTRSVTASRSTADCTRRTDKHRERKTIQDIYGRRDQTKRGHTRIDAGKNALFDNDQRFSAPSVRPLRAVPRSGQLIGPYQKREVRLVVEHILPR